MVSIHLGVNAECTQKPELSSFKLEFLTSGKGVLLLPCLPRLECRKFTLTSVAKIDKKNLSNVSLTLDKSRQRRFLIFVWQPLTGCGEIWLQNHCASTIHTFNILLLWGTTGLTISTVNATQTPQIHLKNTEFGNNLLFRQSQYRLASNLLTTIIFSRMSHHLFSVNCLD